MTNYRIYSILHLSGESSIVKCILHRDDGSTYHIPEILDGGNGTFWLVYRADCSSVPSALIRSGSYYGALLLLESSDLPWMRDKDFVVAALLSDRIELVASCDF